MDSRGCITLTLGGVALTALIYIYTAFYWLFSISTIIDDIKTKEPWWDIASDAVLLPLGGIGILLFILDVSDPTLKFVWKGFSVLIIAGQLVTNVLYRHLTLGEKTQVDPKHISQWTLLFADLTTVIILAPMAVMNVKFAF